MASKKQRQTADTHGRSLGLLPRPGAGALSGTSAPQLEYYRIFTSSLFPETVFLEAVHVQVDEEAADASLDEKWFAIGPDGVTRPFDRFAELPAPLDRSRWGESLEEITTL